MDQVIIALDGQQVPLLIETGSLGLALKQMADTSENAAKAQEAAQQAEAARDDTINGLAAKANKNGSDITSAEDWRIALDLGAAATLNVGTTEGTVAAGDDSRLLAVENKADKDLGNVDESGVARENLQLPRFSPADLGADRSGTALSQEAFGDAVAAGRVSGGAVIVPSGTYRLTQFEVDYTDLTGEPNNDPTGAPLVGEGIQNTILMATEADTYAVKITGGPNAAALVYSGLSNLSVSGENPLPTPDSRGVHVFSAAYHTMRDVGFYNLGVALKLESVLSSTFDNLKISFGINGIEVLKGDGFSFHNANHFSNCEIRHLSGRAFFGGPCTSLRMTALQVESCGTQGNSSTGGLDLTFSGAEGHVGLVLHGGYFEDNAGEADITLTNEGAAYMTHVITGVNFNRLSSSRYVTNCIKSVGKNRILLIGCTFTRVGNYSPDAGRPYLNGDADTVFVPIGCTFQDAVERAGVRNLEDFSFSGSVASSGSANALPPGWSSIKAGTGVYVVTHDLGLTATNHSVVATTNEGNVVTVERAVLGANSFQVITTTPSGSAADGAFTFQLRVI